MKKLADEMFILIFFVLPVLLIYSKGYGYWKETVLEPRLGMKCGDGEPIIKWHEMKEYQIPTHDCTTFRYILEYNKWFVVTTKNLIVEHSPTYNDVKDYIIEIINDTVEVVTSPESE